MENTTITRTFILHDAVLATQTMTTDDLQGSLATASVAYFCPECGELWAKIVYSHHLKWWDLIVRWCDRHADTKWADAMVGCFSDARFVSPLKTYPRAVLLHDLAQVAKHEEDMNRAAAALR